MSDYPDFDPTRTSLPQPYLIALGRVTYIWGGLEAILDLAITKLLGFELHDIRSPAILTHMSWPQRLDILETLIDMFSDNYPHLKRYDKIKPLLKEAQSGRNMLIHSQLAYDESDNTVRNLRVSARGKLKVSTDVITVEKIDGIYESIGQAALELLKLVLNK